MRIVNAASSLDRIDRKILAALQADARLTNQALSDRVALSPSACLARVRRLEREGFIQGYHARLDPFSIEVGLVLFAEVVLRSQGAEDLAELDLVDDRGEAKALRVVAGIERADERKRPR